MKNSKVKSILDEVLKEIQPDKSYEKEIFSRLNEIINKINKNQKNIRAILGGSGAKGTWLRTFDADIFVLFDYGKYGDKSDKLSDILEKILRKNFKIARLHGSRDYFQIKEGDFTFEIVPILRISRADQAKNITDVSPLHSNWVRKHKKLVNEMKLAKQFCQAQNVYGAESYIRGFSGYICEILTVYYGSFLNLVKNAAKWRLKIVIDVEKYYRGNDVFKLVNTSKLASPLIVIDPVQKDRNAAAALSNEKFERFKTAAGQFIKSPSNDFFAKKDLSSAFKELKNSSNKLITVNLAPLPGKIDVVGSKLLKIYDFFVKKLQEHEFKIIKSGWEWDKKNDAVLYILIGKKPLSKTVEIEGPPIAITQHVERFRKIHKKTFVKKDKIYALAQRKYTNPEDLLRSTAKDEFARERSKSVRFKLN